MRPSSAALCGFAWNVQSPALTATALQGLPDFVLALHFVFNRITSAEGEQVAQSCQASHLKTTEDLFDNRGSPKMEAMVAAAVQGADRIMRKVDSVFGTTQ